jgi:class 3 adenylate cyclase/HAMP domain-containing protein
MQFSFLFVTAASILAIIFFSLFYFFMVTRSQATRNMHEKMDVAMLVYDGARERTATFARTLATDSAVQVFLDLNIRNKMSEFLRDITEREKMYQIAVFDANLHPLADVAMADSVMSREQELGAPGMNPLLIRVLSGESVTGTESIPVVSGKVVLSISAANPVYRDGRLVGVVLVRYILNENRGFVGDISAKAHTDIAIFEDRTAVAATTDFTIDSAFHSGLASESIRIWFGGTLAVYRPLANISGQPIAALGVQQSAQPFVDTFMKALLMFLAIASVAIALSVVSVYLVAKGILVPLNQLLFGVNRIAGGDLAFEVSVSLRDEIGELSRAFDEMRQALKDKISTIQEMNENLEGTVKERTSTIEALMQSMRKYLPSQLYDAIVRGMRSDDINAHYRRKLTVFFSDIVNFTSTTESMEAEDLSDLLNDYLDNMAKIAIKWGGTIDKFIGDAIMVFFGDPEYTNDTDHALKAVRMSLEMLVKMKELRLSWLDKGIKLPLHVRIGVNSGYCTVGNFGSENRMDYTIIGGNVNLASRLETAADPDSILISHETYSLIKHEIECVAAGEIPLKGIPQPVRAYKVLGEIGKKQIPEYLDLKPLGIVFKDSLVDPASLDEEARAALVKSLGLALRYAQGTIKYSYDENQKSWRLVNSRS